MTATPPPAPEPDPEDRSHEQGAHAVRAGSCPFPSVGRGAPAGGREAVHHGVGPLHLQSLSQLPGPVRTSR